MSKITSTLKPDGLDAKFKLLALLPYDERTRRKHSLVFGFVLDWYHSKYGDALASVRHVVSNIKERDPAAKGLSLPHVHSALSDLVAWGYLQQTLGAGKRASRYVPNWSLLKSSVTSVGNANDNDRSVTPGVNMSVTSGVNASSDVVTPVGNEDPSTLTRVQDPGNGIDGLECAAPLAPVADGPVGATSPGTAQGGFEELWSAYAHKQKKAEARRAYARLSPDTELHAKLVEAAQQWQQAWSAQQKSDAPRFTLEKWIEREEYECDPPTAFKPKERKPKVASKKPPKRQAAEVAMVGGISPFSSFGTFKAEIFEAEVKHLAPHTQRLTLKIKLGDGTETYHKFNVLDPDLDEQERGRAMLKSITDSLEIDGEVDETDDLLFRPMRCTIGKGADNFFIAYAPLAANDNDLTETTAYGNH